MANYVNWLIFNQPSKDGFIPTQGNAVANHETPASGAPTGVAPKEAQYAMVWADTAVTVQVSAVEGPGPGTGNYTVAIPANCFT